jgi:hypothetical protein
MNMEEVNEEYLGADLLADCISTAIRIYGTKRMLIDTRMSDKERFDAHEKLKACLGILAGCFDESVLKPDHELGEISINEFKKNIDDLQKISNPDIRLQLAKVCCCFHRHLDDSRGHCACH